jgi:hypothetical protein
VTEISARNILEAELEEKENKKKEAENKGLWKNFTILLY